MIPNHQPNTAVSSATPANSASFGISSKDTAHILGILRGQIYTDKILAVLREYASNAWDANIMAGRGDEPISVHLPTAEDLQLRVKDHGPGLSREDVFSVYSQYGASTKRDRPDAVGCLGIGSKSGFSYANNFAIISCHEGKRSIYVAALDASDLGVVNLLTEEDCGDETGVEIQISAKTSDIRLFQEKAQELFACYRPAPDVNTTLPDAPAGRVNICRGVVDGRPDMVGVVDFAGEYGGGSWVAVMGCVPYRIRLSELELPDVHACLYKLSGVLHFPIGAVEFAASREELRYTDRTKASLLRAFTELVDGYLMHVLQSLDAEQTTPFQKRLSLLALRTLDLPLPDEYEQLAKQTTRIFDSADGLPFTMVHAGHDTSQVTVTADLTLYIDDTGKKLNGYALGSDGYVIKPRRRDPESLAVVRTSLDEILAASMLTGVAIKPISTVAWYPPSGSRGVRSNEHRAKHRARMFRFAPATSNGYVQFKTVKSERWEVVERIPQPDDVFVVITNFECLYNEDVYSNYRDDFRLASAFGEKLPEIYGYKSTGKKPITRADCAGTSYSVWRKAWHQSLSTPERLALLDEYEWVRTGLQRCPKAIRSTVCKSLGRSHPISALLRRAAAAARTCDSKEGAISQLYGLTTTRIGGGAQTAIDAAERRYTLLRLSGGIELLWQYRSGEDLLPAWLDYIKMVDTATGVVTVQDEKEDQDDSVQSD